MNSEAIKLEIVSNETELDWAFPNVSPGAEPLGGRVLLQVRRIRKRTAGGLILAAETRDAEKFNTQVAKVIAVGNLAFKRKDTLEPWPEGVWCEVGDFVRCPRYGGDRWEVLIEGDEEPALFLIVNDHEIIGRIIGDPLKMKAFL